MGFNFPASPAVGQLYPATVTPGLPQYRWDGEKWKTIVAVAATASALISDTAPSTPVDGMLWWESDTGNLYIRYNDGDSVQWVIVGQMGSLTGLVRYDAAQGLDYLKQAQARANIGDLKRNYIINGGMQISQENGSNVLAVVNGGYPVDQFYMANTSGGGMNVSQVASLTPGGSPNRIRVAVTIADAAVAAGDVVQIRTKIEGLRLVDLMFGSASAKTIIVQFGCKGPAGIYSFALQNGAGTRSYIAEFTIAVGEANIDVVKSVVIPGDVTGTWATDNTTGMHLFWSLMAGSNYQNVLGWGTTGSASANQSNFMSTVGNTFELFDVGLYEGAAAPPFQVPDFASEYIACTRYYYQMGGAAFMVVGTLRAPGSGGYFPPIYTPAPMRVTPTVTLGTAAAVYAGDNNIAINTMSVNAVGNALFIQPTWTGNLSPGTAGIAIGVYSGTTPTKFSARLP